MRIGVNAVPLRINSGGARYVFAALFNQLLKLDNAHRYIVFTHPAGAGLVREMVQGTNSAACAGAADRVRVIEVFDEELIYPYRDEFDLYFSPFNSLKPRVFDRPSVVILHDIQEQYFPQYFSYADLMARHEAYPELCRAATTVVTVSEFCKRCIVEKFGVDPRKIEVVHIAPQAELMAPDQNDGGSWSGPPLPKTFFFYPANLYPHKNHALLLDALQVLAREREADAAPQVVFTGQKMPGGYPLDEQIKSRNLQDRCRFFSNLSAGEMRFLYRSATAAVMPTMFEGFGMPAVEAMACGCPLICSDIPALREVAGDNALYFPPGDLNALCTRLRQVMSDPSLRAQLIERGYGIARQFTWEAAGRRMLQIFAEAGSRFTVGCSGKVEGKARPRIGILISNGDDSGDLAATLQSLTETHYENLVVGTAADAAIESLEIVRVSNTGAGDSQAVLDFARQANCDLVGLVLAGNRLLPTGLDSLALSLAQTPSCGIHFGEAAVWRGGRYRGVARFRLTGDDMWKIEKLLYPEMFFLAPAALANWHAGEKVISESGKDWRWNLLMAARLENQLAIVRRTLADCDRESMGALAWIKAYRAGMLDFHRLDNSPARVPILRRFEQKARLLSQLLPQPLQHLGTKWWYRLTRPGRGSIRNESPVSRPPGRLP